MQKTIDVRKRRHLSLFGKVTVIKQFVLAKVVFSATFFPVPNAVIKSLSVIIINFVWGGKDKVKRSTVINNIRNGRLNIYDRC